MLNIIKNYNLTDSQNKAVNEILDFLKSDKEVFLLKGYAGVGKTFLVKLLINYFESIDRHYALMAPTGKAARVLQDKTKRETKTIHSTIYLNKDLKEYKDKKDETYKFYFSLRPNDNSNDTIYIVDEASMISDKHNEMEFIRFGSGFLLKDLFEFVNFDANEYTKKIIFIGDNAQLPPVGMNFSPALNKEYLEKTYNVKVNEIEITEIVRQKKDSGILKNSLYLREKLKRKVFNEIVLEENSDVKKLKIENFLNTYLAVSGNKINKNIMVIAYQNETVKKYNQIIREKFFKNSNELQEKDKLIIVKNTLFKGILFSNGDFCLVNKILGNVEHKKIPLNIGNKKNGRKTKYIDLYFRDVSLLVRDLSGNILKIEVKILENLLFSSKPILSSEESKALYIDFKQRYPNLKSNTDEFKQAIKNDPYFNALQVKFGYAITCHKAQGSEWENVILDCSYSQSILNETYFRWLYTAITRASKNLYLINAPEIEIFNKIKIKQKNIVNEKEEKFISIKSTDVENLFGINDEFLLSIYKKVFQIITNMGVEIYDIKHYSFQERYIFKKEEDFLSINIFYNSKNQITKIIFNEENNYLKGILDSLKELENSTILLMQNKSISFENENLEYIFNKLKEILDNEMEILDIKHLSFRERYTFKNETESCIVDIIYNKKYQISNISLVNGSKKLFNVIFSKIKG